MTSKSGGSTDKASVINATILVLAFLEAEVTTNIAAV
jgi:hypothetical protein